MASQKLVSLIVLLILNLSSADNNDFDYSEIDGRIVNGNFIKIEDRPFQLIVLPIKCGGSILNERWAVTAAHCNANAKAENVWIGTGTNAVQYASYNPIYYLDKIINHPSYNKELTGYDNDISLMKTKEKIIFTNKIQPVPLATTLPPAKTSLIVSGYGASGSNQALTDVLLYVDLELYTDEECKKRWGRSITEHMFCAAAPQKDSCQGDSGGPITYKNNGVDTLLGVVSFGAKCADDWMPGVYTSVPKLNIWINGIISDLS